MKKNTNTKRIFALLLTLALVFSLSAAALAVDEDIAEEEQDISSDLAYFWCPNCISWNIGPVEPAQYQWGPLGAYIKYRCHDCGSTWWELDDIW